MRGTHLASDSAHKMLSARSSGASRLRWLRRSEMFVKREGARTWSLSMPLCDGRERTRSRWWCRLLFSTHDRSLGKLPAPQMGQILFIQHMTAFSSVYQPNTAIGKRHHKEREVNILWLDTAQTLNCKRCSTYQHKSEVAVPDCSGTRRCVGIMEC